MPPLTPLPGTAPMGSWRMGNADDDAADGRLANFAIVSRPTPTSVSLIGTGFYLQPKGGFATAAHVAIEAQRLSAIATDSVGIAHTLADGRSFFLPVWKFFIHKTADVAFGIPRYEFVNDTTGTVYRTKVLSLDPQAPNIGAAISTWTYPLHCVSDDGLSGQVLQLQPDFYDGVLEELYEDRGPSVKLIPPYYRTNINLYGGASGGPVFNADGNVFGIASCSYDGATDIAFVTPANALLEIVVPERIPDDDTAGQTTTLAELATRGQITLIQGRPPPKQGGPDV
jgi:hypothetical protein